MHLNQHLLSDLGVFKRREKTYPLSNRLFLFVFKLRNPILSFIYYKTHIYASVERRKFNTCFAGPLFLCHHHLFGIQTLFQGLRSCIGRLLSPQTGALFEYLAHHKKSEEAVLINSKEGKGQGRNSNPNTGTQQKGEIIFNSIGSDCCGFGGINVDQKVRGFNDRLGCFIIDEFHFGRLPDDEKENADREAKEIRRSGTENPVKHQGISLNFWQKSPKQPQGQPLSRKNFKPSKSTIQRVHQKRMQRTSRKSQTPVLSHSKPSRSCPHV